MEAGALAQSSHKVKAGEVKVEGAGAHSEAEVPGKRPTSQGVHRRRRHFPGRPLAALGLRARSRSARSVPRAADSESVALYVFLTLQRRKARRQDETKQKGNRRGRNTRPRIVARNAGSGQRLKTRVPSDRRHASARKRRRRRRRPRKENAGRREGTSRTRNARRPRPQRSRPRKRVWIGKGSQSDVRRALLARDAPSLRSRRAFASGAGCRGCASRVLPGRDTERRA